MAGQQGHLFREPCQALGLPRQPYRLKLEGWPVGITLLDFQIGTKHIAEIVHDPLVRGRGRGRGRREQSEIRWQVTGDSFNQALVGPEVVPPIRDLITYQTHPVQK